MKVKFTAGIIDDNGNVVGKRTSEEACIPSMEEFDLSTRDGFLGDFDLLEKAVLKARNQIGADITDELLDGTLKKNCISCSRIRKTAVESEPGRIPVSVMDELAQSIQPKERLYSNGCRDLSCKLCTKLSYRDAAEMLNRFQHRDASQTMKLRTLSGCMERMGSQISEELEKTTGNIQNGQEAYVLTACGMKKAMRSMLAFLIFNGLLRSRLVFFTDGARNIKNSIEEMFAFHPYTVILDWYHLKKKYQELLSMAVKGKDARNKTLGKLLRILWVGDVKGAISYLEGLPSSMIKNPK